MDPNAALENMRSAIKAYDAAVNAENGDAEADAAWELSEAARALDEWLSKGGFLPTAWQNRP